MMLPAIVLSAAQQLVVVLKNSVRRGYNSDGNKDGNYDGPMVFMGKEEKARHVLCKTKYLWLWQYVPFATPVQKYPYKQDYGYVTTSTVSRFAQDNPRVKILDLDGCRNMGIDGIAAVGTNCGNLKKLSMVSCGLKGTVYYGACMISVPLCVVPVILARINGSLFPHVREELPATIGNLQALTSLIVWDNRLSGTCLVEPVVLARVY
jgi:hypothetical protein